MMKEDHEDINGLCVMVVCAENNGKEKSWDLGLK